MIRKFLLGLFLFSVSGIGGDLWAQGSETYGSGLKVSLNPEGNRYIRFIVWNQFWARYIENNPGTMVNGQLQDNTFDFGLRRARILAYAQLSPRYLIMTHIGINNQTFFNGGAPGGGLTGNAGTIGVNTDANGVSRADGRSAKKPGLFFHDVWNEYTVLPGVDPTTGERNNFTLSVGGGLHYWGGVSRLTNASTLNFLMIDSPIFPWHNIDISDQFARQFGVYVKGKLGRFDYRFNANKPFTTFQTPTVSPSTRPVAVDNNLGSNQPSYGGYVFYEFLDRESNLLPFMVGTYIGTKRVFNIGGGFYRHGNATKSNQRQISGMDTTFNLVNHNASVLSVDVFADLPFGGEQNMAFTFYGAAMNYDYGPNYQRLVGLMNVGTTDASFPEGQRAQDGPGNGRLLLGTGQIYYAQAGLLLPKNWVKGRLQPFASYTRKNMEARVDGGNFYDAGLNYFIDGHHCKLTLQYSTRPLYIDGRVDRQLGELILQTHIFL